MIGDGCARRATLLGALGAALMLIAATACARPLAPTAPTPPPAAAEHAASKTAVSAKPEFVEFYSTL